jgi:hypothetical protein
MRLINKAAGEDGGQLLFFKMIQSEDFSFHHAPELSTKHQITVDLTNETRGVSFSKRLFFNKANFNIGFVQVRPGDTLRMAFCDIIASGTPEEKRQVI